MFVEVDRGKMIGGVGEAGCPLNPEQGFKKSMI